MTTTVLPVLSPLNDFAVTAKLKDIDAATGNVSALTAGAVTAFIAVDNQPSTGAADPTLTMNPAHLGNGTWLIFFDATVLTANLLNTLFGAGATPYLIIQYPSGFRKYAQLSYQASSPAVVQ